MTVSVLPERAGPAVTPTVRSDTTLTAFLAPLRDLLDAPGVTELCVNRPGEVFTECEGRWMRHARPALSFTHLRAFSRALATFTGQHVDEAHPLLSATLPTGERVQVVEPGAVAADTLAMCIRKPPLGALGLDDLGRQGLFAGSAARPERARPADDLLQPFEHHLLGLHRRGAVQEFLRMAVQHHRTIVIAGRTGSGKTTLMRALAEVVSADERLITIEDAAELLLPRHANALHLFYSRGDQGASRVTARSLLEACLRLRPDRIFLAEMRGEEAFSFLRLAASGHPGSLTTVHAGSPALAFQQIALMARENQAGRSLTMPELLALARSVVDVVVQIDVDRSAPGGRVVREIHYDPLAQRAAAG